MLFRAVLAAFSVLPALLGAGGALAHPHVWVTTRAVVLFEPDGRLKGIRHSWTFDEGYSAYATQGLEGPDGQFKPDKLAELAKINMESLTEQGFFTLAKANGAKLTFAEPVDPRVTVEGGRMTLGFTLPVKEAGKTARIFSLEVYDPTFFVDFAIDPAADAVRLDGAPKGCATTVRRPKPDAAAQSKNLSESFLSALSSASNVGAQFSSNVLVACP